MQGPVTNNYSRFCDRSVDAAYERALVEGGAAWAAVDRRVAAVAPVAPTITRRSVVYVSERVGSTQLSPILGPLLDQTWLR